MSNIILDYHKLSIYLFIFVFGIFVLSILGHTRFCLSSSENCSASCTIFSMSSLLSPPDDWITTKTECHLQVYETDTVVSNPSIRSVHLIHCLTQFLSKFICCYFLLEFTYIQFYLTLLLFPCPINIHQLFLVKFIFGIIFGKIYFCYFLLFSPTIFVKIYFCYFLFLQQFLSKLFLLFLLFSPTGFVDIYFCYFSNNFCQNLFCYFSNNFCYFLQQFLLTINFVILFKKIRFILLCCSFPVPLSFADT